MPRGRGNAIGDSCEGPESDLMSNWAFLVVSHQPIAKYGVWPVCTLAFYNFLTCFLSSHTLPLLSSLFMSPR